MPALQREALARAKGLLKYNPEGLFMVVFWLRGQDSNLRPLGYEYDESRVNPCQAV
jgi:hypothetical protein